MSSSEFANAPTDTTTPDEPTNAEIVDDADLDTISGGTFTEKPDSVHHG
jgi:hypothetical protein